MKFRSKIMAAAVGRAQQAGGVVLRPAQEMSTAEKIRKFLCSPCGIGTMFSILAGVAAAAAWGVGFGLLVGVLAGAATLAIRAQLTLRPPERNLDPAQRIAPGPYERHPITVEQVGELAQIQHILTQNIFRQSPHFENRHGIFEYLRDHFLNVDYGRLSLHAARPIRYNGNQEGYEVTLLSERPQGWIRFYVSKQDGWVSDRVVNLQRIRQVAPFLRTYEAEQNHLSTLNLPFRETGQLHLAFASGYRQMDLTQLRLETARNVHFEHVYRPMGTFILHTIPYDGHELTFNTPRGRVVFYASADGAVIAKREDVRNLAIA